MLVVPAEHQATVNSILYRLQVIDEVLSSCQHHSQPPVGGYYEEVETVEELESQQSVASAVEKAPQANPLRRRRGGVGSGRRKNSHCYRQPPSWQPERQPWEEFLAEQEWDGDEASKEEIYFRWRYHPEYIPPPEGRRETKPAKNKRVLKMQTRFRCYCQRGGRLSQRQINAGWMWRE